MPPIIFPAGYRVAMGYKEGDKDRVNVFYVRQVDETEPALSAIADAFDTHDASFGAALRTAGTTLNTITVTDVRTALQSQHVKAISPPRPGTNASNPLPGNVTSTASWRGLFTGRKFRGRSYMVDTPTDSITGNETITGLRQGQIASWGQALILACEAAFLVLGIGSKVDGVIHDIKTVVVEQVLDSMRRRLPKRGS